MLKKTSKFSTVLWTNKTQCTSLEQALHPFLKGEHIHKIPNTWSKCVCTVPAHLSREELRCPKQVANVKNKTTKTKTHQRQHWDLQKFCFGFTVTMGVKRCYKDPFSDADDKWLTDKKKRRGRQALAQVNTGLSWSHLRHIINLLLTWHHHSLWYGQ